MKRWVERRRWDLIFVGVDWAEKHHDVCVMDGAGTSLQSFRIAEGIKGIERMHATIAEHCQDQTRWSWVSRPTEGSWWEP
jgi:hypothetical protein